LQNLTNLLCIAKTATKNKHLRRLTTKNGN